MREHLVFGLLPLLFLGILVTAAVANDEVARDAWDGYVEEWTDGEATTTKAVSIHTEGNTQITSRRVSSSDSLFANQTGFAMGAVNNGNVQPAVNTGANNPPRFANSGNRGNGNGDRDRMRQQNRDGSCGHEPNGQGGERTQNRQQNRQENRQQTRSNSNNGFGQGNRGVDNRGRGTSFGRGNGGGSNRGNGGGSGNQYGYRGDNQDVAPRGWDGGRGYRNGGGNHGQRGGNGGNGQGNRHGGGYGNRDGGSQSGQRGNRGGGRGNRGGGSQGNRGGGGGRNCRR